LGTRTLHARVIGRVAGSSPAKHFINRPLDGCIMTARHRRDPARARAAAADQGRDRSRPPPRALHPHRIRTGDAATDGVGVARRANRGPHAVAVLPGRDRGRGRADRRAAARGVLEIDPQNCVRRHPQESDRAHRARRLSGGARAARGRSPRSVVHVLSDNDRATRPARGGEHRASRRDPSRARLAGLARPRAAEQDGRERLGRHPADLARSLPHAARARVPDPSPASVAHEPHQADRQGAEAPHLRLRPADTSTADRPQAPLRRRRAARRGAGVLRRNGADQAAVRHKNTSNASAHANRNRRRGRLRPGSSRRPPCRDRGEGISDRTRRGLQTPDEDARPDRPRAFCPRCRPLHRRRAPAIRRAPGSLAGEHAVVTGGGMAEHPSGEARFGAPYRRAGDSRSPARR
jgi:hypothetical protein